MTITQTDPLPQKAQDALELFLKNEPDVAYQERTKRLFRYLELSKSDTILDCGCGLGPHLALLKRIHPESTVLGIEFDSVRIHKAAEFLRHEAGLIQASIYKMPFLAGSFDKVLCSEVLEHLENDEAALKEIFRILKNGGILTISVPNENYPFSWDPVNRIRTALKMAPLRTGLFSGAWTDHQRLYQMDDLVKKLTAAGFRVTEKDTSSSQCFPFAHLFIYKIGLALAGLFPSPAGQVRFGKGDMPYWHPYSWFIKFFQFFGKESQEKSASGRFINITIKAVKP